MDFAQRVVVIPGGGGGWGRKVVEAFLRTQATVIVVERAEVTHNMETWKAELGDHAARLHAVPSNVFDEAAVEHTMHQVVQRHGRLDVLVNMVGGFAAGQPVDQLELETFERMLNLNLRSTFLCSKYAARPMIQQHWGRIINIASRSGVQPSPKAAAYAAAKAAVISLTKAQAEELKQQMITVNAIVPSIVDTPANRQAMPDADFSRWPKGEEIAAVMLFLASEEAKLISGAAIPVYGRA